MAKFDIFGYSLSPWHYGTAEQALIEEMSAGVPPVVLDNGAESFIIDNGITGFIAKDSKEYSSIIRELYNSRKLLEQISKQTKQVAKEKFSLQHMMGQLHDLFEELIKKGKSIKSWQGMESNKNISPAMVFLESIGVCRNMFESSEQIQELANSSPLWRAKTKGTPAHYATFFPDDPILNQWSTIIKNDLTKENR